jgi:hypothetical protein
MVLLAYFQNKRITVMASGMGMLLWVFIHMNYLMIIM